MPLEHNVGRSLSVLSGNSSDGRVIQDFVSGDRGSRCEATLQAPRTVRGSKSTVGLNIEKKVRFSLTHLNLKIQPSNFSKIDHNTIGLTIFLNMPVA